MAVFNAQHENEYGLFVFLQRYMEVSANLRDSYEDKDGQVFSMRLTCSSLRDYS